MQNGEMNFGMKSPGNGRQEGSAGERDAQPEALSSILRTHMSEGENQRPQVQSSYIHKLHTCTHSHTHACAHTHMAYRHIHTHK